MLRLALPNAWPYILESNRILITFDLLRLPWINNNRLSFVEHYSVISFRSAIQTHMCAKLSLVHSDWNNTIHVRKNEISCWSVHCIHTHAQREYCARTKCVRTCVSVLSVHVECSNGRRDIVRCIPVATSFCLASRHSLSHSVVSLAIEYTPARRHYLTSIDFWTKNSQTSVEEKLLIEAATFP